MIFEYSKRVFFKYIRENYNCISSISIPKQFLAHDAKRTITQVAESFISVVVKNNKWVLLLSFTQLKIASIKCALIIGE